jgi:regulatory protein YycH of two-component signal transduction system YycFG
MIYKYAYDIGTFDDFADVIADFRKRFDYYDEIKMKIFQDDNNMLIDSFTIDRIYIDIVDAYNNIIYYKNEYQGKILYLTIDKI